MCEKVRVPPPPPPPWGLNTNANLYLMLYTGLFKKVHHTGTILWFEQVEINLCHYFITLPELNSLHAGKFYMIFVVCRLYSKSKFSKISFRNAIRMSNSLDPDQARHFVGPDLGPNCLQRLSADDTSRKRPILL